MFKEKEKVNGRETGKRSKTEKKKVLIFEPGNSSPTEMKNDNIL